MAGKKFPKKQKSPWPWITGFTILAGFIWFILIYVYIPGKDSNNILTADFSYGGSRYKPPADTVNEVREFIQYSRNADNTLTAKKYSEKGLIKLQSALSYLADRVDSIDISLKNNIDSLDRKVAMIDTSTNNYIGELKPALSVAVTTIESIQKLNYPYLANNIRLLRKAENRIDIKKSITSQLKNIRHFFAESGDTLQKMKLSYSLSLNKNSY
jgi:hypothetical protein